jgi:adenylate cyclase class IV
MRCNLEIKTRCPNLARARTRRLGSQRIVVDHQVDTYFHTGSGRLKLRESSLSGGQLVPYRCPDVRGPCRSDYQVVALEDPAALKRILAELLGVREADLLSACYEALLDGRSVGDAPSSERTRASIASRTWRKAR